jgi:serine protease Do
MSRVATAGAVALAGALGVAVGVTVRDAPWIARPRPAVGPLASSFADIVQRTNEAVVEVAALDPPVIEGEEPEEGEDAAGADAPSRRGDGAGFIIDQTGLILTNQHLVGASPRVRVRLSDGREFRAKVVGGDESTDLALLKIDAGRLSVVTLGDSDRLRVGDWVVAIGNPLSFEHTVTVGVVSSKGRKIFDASFDAYIQTDAAINPGNSGGPILNAAGEVVGISAAVSREGQGIGFAIPINVAKEVAAELRQHGKISRGYLGAQLADVDRDLAALLRLPDARGAVVVDLVPGSSGDLAGLRRYDVLKRVNGHPVANSDAVIHLVSAVAPGTEIGLETWRDGRAMAFKARLTERASASPASASPSPHPKAPVDALGLAVTEATAVTAADQGSRPRGVVVETVRNLTVGGDTLDRGDVIVEVNRRPTPDLATYRAVVDALTDGTVAWLYVYRPSANATFLAKLAREGAAETK